jgi:serine/threonine protein kinase/Tol biopolymer transport system component
MIGNTISHYKILERLGGGGMGVVYKAEDLKLTRTVALKFLPHGLDAHEPERARFLQEARAAAILNHPYICTVYDIQEHDDQPFIVMEYVEGKTLREIVPIKKMQDAITYAIQIAEALQEAHTHGIVHRDIKAENIMVNSKNQVKVMDFGLAKVKGSLKLTKTSSTIGTLAYMAPEQIQGQEVDARSDIFSFGIVLYEMLTGHLPFRGEHDAAMMYSIVNDDPEPLQHYIPDAQSELLHILDRALEKDREDRYQAVHEMLIDLRRLKKDSTRVSRQLQFASPMSGGTQPVPVAEAKNGWSKRLWLGIAGIMVLCVICSVYLLLRTHAARLNPNRTSVTLGVPFKELGYPSLSLDGNWLAFSARDEDQTWDVYLMNIAAGKPSRVTHESGFYLQVCDISPDVSQIVYDCLKCEPNTVSKIKLVVSQGGESRTLADTGAYPKWRPDGTRIGYVRVGRGGQLPSISGKLEIWSIRPDGTDNRLEIIDTVTTHGPNAFCWSHDGRSITWIRNYPEGYGEVMVRELATGEELQLTSDRKNVDEVIWAANEQILFLSNKSGQTNLWMISACGGEATQVTQGAISIFGSKISGDDKTVVYMQVENIGTVWISRLDGSNAHQITSDNMQVTNVSFSPDGKHVAYIVADVDPYNPESHLYVMDRDGMNQRQMTFGSEIVSLSSWSPDSRWIAVGSRMLGEPSDSSKVYLIQPFNPGPARLLCKGTWFWWADNESVHAVCQMKTLRYSIKGGTPTQVSQDSLFAFPMNRRSELVVYDYREEWVGLWVVSVDSQGRQRGEARRRIFPPDAMGIAFPYDLRFWTFKRRNEVWRVWTSTGKEEQIGKALPGDTWMKDVSMDGKEILWISKHYPAKLVLVKHVFE